ncbi:hypothetical protein QYE76_001057 [Lolium multiflorum]|uniref:Transposase (putative) gypsy type domain-containing protein n=1 Tax=Lolium multiflorum TaxID=4521 RepID=A0AAD8RM88_LOLMU|nr:hypothetical protein QYE76_001057 [Lolium multiflorum]
MLQEEIDGLGEEAGGPDQDAGPDPASYTRGAWKGSNVSEVEIDWLYRSRRIPEEVFCRIPDGELEPAPNPGEVVVFTAHFERGFGLPASDFFRRFLDFYELQPHHLPGNAVFYLSSFISFIEGFVGLLPTIETFARFYNLRINSIQDPQLPIPKPVVHAPARTNWRFSPKNSHDETDRIIQFIKTLNNSTNICADDIVHAFVSRRVVPLQRRAHKMCQMTGRFDPTRITTFLLSKSDVVAKAKQICKTKMPVDWKWGLQPHSHRRPPASQVLEHVTPLATEVGYPPVSRARKAPAPEAGSSSAPASKRQKILSSGPPKKKKKKNTIPISSGPALEQTGWSEPLVPPVLEKTSKVPTSSPTKTSSSIPSKPPSSAKGTAAPPPASANKPPPAPSSKKFSRKSANITAEQLSGAVQAASAQPTGSQALTLHAGRAAIATSEKVSAQLGRIVELNRGKANLGSLQRYVDDWNLSDMTEATLGLGKDGKPAVDVQGLRSTVQHMHRLKRSVREFDNDWHDVNNNVLHVLDSRKKIFENLLWEHRDLTEAFAALQLTHSRCQGFFCATALPEASLDDLVSQVAALKGKPDLSHQRDLQAQRNETANLKEQLVLAGLQHAGALKEAISAGEAKVEEAKKQLADAQEQLRQELEEERKLRKLEQERNNELSLVQASIGQLIKDVDDKARSRYVPKRPLLSSIADRLLDAGKQLSEWRHSTAWAGADMALWFVCSWYESLDLSTLNTMCGDAPTNTDPAKATARRDWAYRIACYASTSTFIPPPADIEDELTDDEEEAKDGEAEEEAEENAPEEAAAGNN